MELFEKLDSILKPGCEVQITTRKQSDGTLVNLVSFRNDNVKDNAKAYIPPFKVSGTARELDESFAFVIDVPLQKTAGLLTNMEDYEKALAVAEKNRKEEADRKAAEKKAADAAEKKAKKAAEKAVEKPAEPADDTPDLFASGDEAPQEQAPEADGVAEEEESIDDLPDGNE